MQCWDRIHAVGADSWINSTSLPQDVFNKHYSFGICVYRKTSHAIVITKYLAKTTILFLQCIYAPSGSRFLARTLTLILQDANIFPIQLMVAVWYGVSRIQHMGWPNWLDRNRITSQVLGEWEEVCTPAAGMVTYECIMLTICDQVEKIRTGGWHHFFTSCAMVFVLCLSVY